jgi:hypothetical protein
MTQHSPKSASSDIETLHKTVPNKHSATHAVVVTEPQEIGFGEKPRVGAIRLHGKHVVAIW